MSLIMSHSRSRLNHEWLMPSSLMVCDSISQYHFFKITIYVTPRCKSNQAPLHRERSIFILIEFRMDISTCHSLETRRMIVVQCRNPKPVKEHTPENHSCHRCHSGLCLQSVLLHNRMSEKCFDVPQHCNRTES